MKTQLKINRITPLTAAVALASLLALATAFQARAQTQFTPFNLGGQFVNHGALTGRALNNLGNGPKAPTVGNPSLAFADVTIPGLDPVEQVFIATGINNAGAIVGAYSSSSPDDPVHSFMLKNGVVTDGPTSFSYAPLNGNNDAGITAGVLPDASGVLQSLLWSPDGTIIHLPSAGVLGPNSFTYMLAINNRGLVVGFAGSDTVPVQPVVYENGNYTFLQVPGAQSGVAWGVNDRDQVVGHYTDASSVTRQYVKTGSNYALFDLGTSSPDLNISSFTGINNREQIVGFLTDSGGTTHGLFFDHGTKTLVDPPTSVFTLLYSINDHGQAVGVYVDQDGFLHGFQVTIGKSH